MLPSGLDLPCHAPHSCTSLRGRLCRMSPLAITFRIFRIATRLSSTLTWTDPNSDGLVTVSITCLKWTPTTAQIYPLRAAAILPLPVISGSTVTVKVDQPRQICVIINGITDSPLCIFADPNELLPLPSQLHYRATRMSFILGRAHGVRGSSTFKPDRHCIWQVAHTYLRVWPCPVIPLRAPSLGLEFVSWVVESWTATTSSSIATVLR